jgi:hypothetical protein
MDAPWATRWPAGITQRFGAEELHQVLFEPDGWPGHGVSVNLVLPECQLVIAFPAADGEPTVYVNRPQSNRNVKRWRFACEAATKHRFLLGFCCDTAQQAEQAARRAARWLPSRRRMSLERILTEPSNWARSAMS